MSILKNRKSLRLLAGKSYFFFCTLLLSSIFLSAALILFGDTFFKFFDVSGAIMSAVPLVPKASPTSSDFILALTDAANSFLKSFFSSLPTFLIFLLCLIFLVSPIYQGTIRWSAYLIEEKHALPISAAVFYFTSPALYFKSVLLSIKLITLKLLYSFLFFMPVGLFFLIGRALSSDYIGQKALGSAASLLSIILIIPIFILYMIFCARFSAVRYLFALGYFKKIFKSSKKILRKKSVAALFLNLRLCLNLLPALFIIPAPACLSQAICGKCLFINSLLVKKQTKRASSL